jgi:hypothetical protein
MATASRTRHPAGAKPRPRSASLTALRARDALDTWLIPALAVVIAMVCAGLGAAGVLATPSALSGTLLAALSLLLFIGMRPLIARPEAPRARLLGAALGLVWLIACYLPFHARLFPGEPLLPTVNVTAAGSGLPLRIPAAAHRAIDLVLEGTLVPLPGGGAAPLAFQLTIADQAGGTQTVAGRFEDTPQTRRLGRRGTTVVHQLHTAERHTLDNPDREDLTVTKLSLEPDNNRPVAITAFAHPLPPRLVLGLGAAVLLAAVIAFDRLGPIPDTDGALTLATGGVLGSAVIFWTSDAAHPDFQTFIGALIFGGILGYIVSGLLWWMAKRVIVRST